MLGQRVLPKTAKLFISEYNSVTEDGILSFQIDVKLSDCLSHIEIIDLDGMKLKKNLWDRIYDWWWFKVRKRFDFQIAKKYELLLDEENYFLKEESQTEEIFMKCHLLSLKSIFGRKTSKKKLQINLYSKSSKKIYSKNFILDKNKILEKGEVRIGIEPI